jgi:hypothetical protein
MLENNYSLAPPSSSKSPVPYVTLLNLTLGHTSYFHAHNNISMPYALNVIIKRSTNFANSFYPTKKHVGVFLLIQEILKKPPPPPPTIQFPLGLLPCTCNTPRCYCNAHFKPDLLCVQGIPYQYPPPTTPTSSITIQFIEFTFCND